jgi:hypothetical protein
VPYTLAQLEQALARDLTACHTDHERIMCKAIAGREIREKAILIASSRPLTMGELAIAQRYGYHR